MSIRPTAFLKTSASAGATKILVRADSDEVLKAVLPAGTTPHPRALPMLLEAMALWYQAPAHAVLCATEPAWWYRLGLLDELYVGADTVHYTVELRPRGPDRRPQRVAGLGSFDDLRQLMLRGVR